MYSVGVKESKKRFSLLVNEALDCLGYSQEQIQRRVSSVENSGRLLGEALQTFLNTNVEVCLFGSRGEGVPFKSDYDYALIHRSAICVEEGSDDDSLFIFNIEMTGSPPGYTKLSVNQTVNLDVFSIATICLSKTSKIVGDKSIEYLSSLKYQNTIRRLMSSQLQIDYVTSRKESNGPAISVTANIQVPFYNISMSVENDIVQAFPAYVPSILNSRRSRRRFLDWPSQTLIDDIASMEAVCVPVSNRESKDYDLEWRFCFPQGDKKLILSMNDSQIKLYVLLKVIFTDIVNKKKLGLTSYMIKNIVCWTCEGMASKHFTPELFVDRLKNSLFFLKQCLENHMLPCYLLSTRNLLIGKMDGYMKIHAIHEISVLLNSNASYLIQCNQLSKSMFLIYMHPLAAMKAMSVRNLLEESILVVQQILIKYFQFKKDVLLSTWYLLLCDPDMLEAAFALMNSIGIDMVLQLLDIRFLDRKKSSFLNMMLV